MKNSGLSHPNGAVSGHEYPWIVAIYNATDTFICGGTIISLDYVLTGTTITLKSINNVFLRILNETLKNLDRFLLLYGNYKKINLLGLKYSKNIKYVKI